METTAPLFAEFAAHRLDDWKKQAAAELKGANPDEKLLWQTPEGLSVSPMFQGTAPSAASQYLHQSLVQEAPATGQLWRNRLVIALAPGQWAAANQQALQWLQRGVDEIAFDARQVSAETIDFEVLLNDILLPYCGVSWVAGNAQAAEALLQGYLAYAQQKGYALHSLSGALDVAETPSPQALAALAATGREATHWASIGLHAPADTVADELADLLAQAKQVLDAAAAQGLALHSGQIRFNKHLGSNFFLEIAGLRALRLLAAEVMEQYGMACSPATVCLHALTTPKTDEAAQKDPYLNMIANTTQAMSALIGTAQVLTVRPHTEGLAQADEFAQRIAANVSNLLLDEAYFAKVIDPGAGAYYIEHLTDLMLAAAWQKFQEKIA